MRRRKIKSGNGEPMKKYSFIMMVCSRCGINEEKVDAECESVICWECIQKMVPVDPEKLVQRKPPTATTTTVTEDGKTITVTVSASKRPRGWRFMKEFVDADGTVYHSGEEMPDLKGTLSPTDVVAIKAAQKVRSKEHKAHKAEREAKKQAKLLKEFEKKKRMKERDEKRKAKEMKKLLDSQKS